MWTFDATSAAAEPQGVCSHFQAQIEDVLVFWLIFVLMLAVFSFVTHAHVHTLEYQWQNHAKSVLRGIFYRAESCNSI